VVYEKGATVAGRFHGDFQGIENYSTPDDALEELARAGVEPTFAVTPFCEATLFGPDGREWRYRASAPLYYMIRRGAEPGRLDAALLDQALAQGVRVRFQRLFPDTEPRGILATGPRGSYAIVVGYIGTTTLPDLVLAALDDRLAPGGYAYLVTHAGTATVAACLFADLPRHRQYLDRTVAYFQERTGLSLDGAVRFGGTGNVRRPRTARRGAYLLAGEAAGFQDALWGFGLRSAMLSGHLAARAFLEGDADRYDALWQARLGGLLETSIVNRFVFGRLGNRGYGMFLSRLGRAPDPREFLRRHYAPSAWKGLWFRRLRLGGQAA
jgi:flavin-dependent dehydrogenase